MLRAVGLERMRQDEIHGEGELNIVNRSPASGFQVLTEELGEAAKASLDQDVEGYIRELVHSAAVLVAMAEAALRISGATFIEREGHAFDPRELKPEQFEGSEVVEVWRIFGTEVDVTHFAPMPYQFVLAYPRAADARNSPAHAAANALGVCGLTLEKVRTVKAPRS